MDYLIQKKIFHLSNRIKIFKKAIVFDRKDQKILIQELDWRISDLVSALVQKSELTIPFPTREHLKIFYEKQSDKSFTLESLFEKFWLREILDRIEVPYSIKSASDDLNKPFPKEFDFALLVSDFFKKENKTELTDAELQTLVTAYNLTNPEETLNEKILHDKGIITKDSLYSKKYVFREYAQYLLFLFENQHQLRFIKSFCDEYLNMDKKKYRINKQTAQEIINRHRTLYPKCPDIDQWEKVYAFKELEEFYHFKFSSDSNRTLWETLSGEIAGKLWMAMLEDETSSENEKLNTWLDKLYMQQEQPQNYLSHIAIDKKSKFLSIAQRALLSDQDITDSTLEIHKLILEKSTRDGSRHLYHPPQIAYSKEQSMAAKYNTTQLLETYDDTLLYEEHCRERLVFLLKTLIEQDRIAGENVGSSIQTIRHILELSTDKPFLLWETCFILQYHKPEVIPYLLPFDGSAELAFILLQEIEINQNSFLYAENEFENQLEKQRNQFILEGVDILLAYMIYNQTKINKGDLLSSILSGFAINLFDNKYYTQYNSQSLYKEPPLFYDRLWLSISSYRGNRIVFANKGSYKPFLMLIIWNEFLTAIAKFTPKESFNEFYAPYLWRFDILIRFLKVVHELPEADKILLKKYYAIDTVKIEGEICKCIQEKYFEVFVQSEVKFRWSLDSDFLARPLQFQSRAFGVDRIDWTIFYTLMNPALRTQFLQQGEYSFDLSNCSSELEFYKRPEIENSIHRLRFHLKILLNIHTGLINQPYLKDYELLNQVEKQITHLFCEYSKTDLAANKVNIFRDRYDSGSEFKLLNRLVENIVLFKPDYKKKNLSHLATTDQFDKLLYVSNLLTAKGDIDYVLRQLTKERLEKYLQQHHSYYELETALVHAINNPELLEIASTIISSIEIQKWHIDTHQKHQRDRMLFHIKLLFYFRKGEIQQIKDLPVPNAPHIYQAQYNREDTLRKRYHEILFSYGQGQAQEALKDTGELILQDPDNPMYYNLRFSIRINLAKTLYEQDIEEGKPKIREALEEFQQAEEKFKEDSVTDITLTEIICNKMECYHLLELYQQFDAVMVLLSKEDRLKEEFSKLIITNKLSRKQYMEAALLCDELKQYHILRSGKVPEFIDELNILISSSDEHIEVLKKSYKNILTLPAQKRFLVLPGSVSDHQKDLGMFLLGELVRAATALQRKLYALLGKGEDVRTITEDKISDLLELLLNARLGAWDLNWTSQARVGTTGNDTNELARADLSLPMDGKTFVAEALRIYAYSSVEQQKDYIIDHIIKSFNQTANRNFLYQLSYYQGDDFETNWEAYKNVVSSLNFPDRFKKLSGIETISEKSSPDLMVAFTKHDQNVVCYYLFVNLAYGI